MTNWDWLDRAWLPVALSAGVGTHVSRGKRCGTPLVLWRGEDGHVNALADRCPHRGAALSLGEVVSGGIRCAYHGLVFDGTGRCAAMPCQAEAYLVEEVLGVVFVAKTRPEGMLAVVQDLPRPLYAFCDDVSTNAFNVIDNLFDLEHLAHVHHGSFSAGVAGEGARYIELADGFDVAYTVRVEARGSFATLAPIATHAYVTARYLPPLIQVFVVKYDSGLTYGSMQAVCPTDAHACRLFQVGFGSGDPSVDERVLRDADWDIWLEDKRILNSIADTQIEDFVRGANVVPVRELHSSHIIRAARRTLAV